MLTNNKFRIAIIALAATTLMACNSGPSEEEIAAEKTRIEAAEKAAADKAAAEKAEAEKARVEAANLAQKKRMEEAAARELEELKNANTVYFDFDRSTIKSDFMPVLAKHAAYLVKNPNQSITIEGHCDQRGTPEYNIALGERRAKAVATYFRNAGVSSSQVTVVSYGEEKPAVMGASEYAQAQNRRGVVVYN